MWQSFKEYITALGHWGWAVVGDVILSGVGAYIDISGRGAFPPTWLWILLLVSGLAVAPLFVFHKVRVQRDKLQAEKDSQEPNVELTDFDYELPYKRMTGYGANVIVIRLAGILRNMSPKNYGCLDFFRVEIPTPRGIYLATSHNPPLGYKFEPNSIYSNKLFSFTGDFNDPLIGLESWEPLIKGAKGVINLAVQGQKIKTYPIKIADKEGFG